MSVLIRVEVGRTPDIADDIDDATRALAALLGKEAVQELQSAGSMWPVLTGLSKASFWALTVQDQAVIRNFTDYAGDVETMGTARTPPGTALATLTSGLDAIAERLDRRISAELDADG